MEPGLSFGRRPRAWKHGVKNCSWMGEGMLISGRSKGRKFPEWLSLSVWDAVYYHIWILRHLLPVFSFPGPIPETWSVSSLPLHMLLALQDKRLAAESAVIDLRFLHFSTSGHLRLQAATDSQVPFRTTTPRPRSVYSFILLHWILVTTHGTLNLWGSMQTLSCSMWDLVHWLGIKPMPAEVWVLIRSVKS